MKTPESAVLRACLDYLRLRGHFVFRVNGGGFETKRGGFVRCTDISGVADIVGITDNCQPLAVECKSAKGKLSITQKVFKEAWIERGGVYVLARSVEDLQEAGL
jgi:Holliday junction resolvase